VTDSHSHTKEIPAFKLWVMGARPRTLPAAVVPVLVGAALAVGSAHPVWWRIGLALVVSLSLQVGVNYANDYSDGVKGTDAVRVGPVRLVGSGLVAPKLVKRAALMSFGCAAVCGLVLSMATTPWLLLVGVCAIAAGWTYTGGPRPYGYLGLGEIFVFIFFGVVATLGSAYVVAEELTSAMWISCVPVGCFACALLVVNNLRDIPTDSTVGKNTLAVRLGDARTRQFFLLLFALSAVFVIAVAVQKPAAILGLVGPASARGAVRTVCGGATGRDLIVVLGATGRAQLIFGLLFSLGLLIANS